LKPLDGSLQQKKSNGLKNHKINLPHKSYAKSKSNSKESKGHANQGFAQESNSQTETIMSREQQKLWEKIAMAIAISAVGWLFWTTSQNSIAIARGEERDTAITKLLTVSIEAEKEHNTEQNQTTKDLTKAVDALKETVFEMKGVFSALDFTQGNNE
jgi:hypothetical protein